MEMEKKPRFAKTLKENFSAEQPLLKSISWV
jgi:hypothetical protein